MDDDREREKEREREGESQALDNDEDKKWSTKKKNDISYNALKTTIIFWRGWFYGISTILGYLKLNPFLYI